MPCAQIITSLKTKSFVMQLPNNEYPAYYEKYLPLLSSDDLIVNLENANSKLIEITADISEEKWKHKYAEGKWSVKEVINHVTDTERVLSYRAMCFSRGEKNALPGFDENVYSKNSGAANRSSESIIHEAVIVRQASIELFRNMNIDQLMIIGNGNGQMVSVRALGHFLAAHQLHHLNVILERYL